MKKTLSYQYLTDPDIFNPIDLAQESCCFGNQDFVSSHNLELDQYSTFDKLVSYHFNEIELKHECDHDPQLCDSVSIFDSILTLVFLPDLDHNLEPTLIPIPVNLEHESPIMQSHFLLLENECEL